VGGKQDWGAPSLANDWRGSGNHSGCAGTGINRDNHDLADRVVAEVSFTDSPTSDEFYGHGAHMGGTIAAIAR
jgi:hypothetical protein